MTRLIGTVARVCVLGMAFLAAGGCSQTHSVKGKVIRGNLSFVAVVDQGDERLKSDESAVVDAEIAVRTDVGTLGGAVFGEAKTDKKGNFTMKFKEQNAFLKPVEFSADREGFQPARGVMHLPPAERRVLIIMAPGKGGGQGGSGSPGGGSGGH